MIPISVSNFVYPDVKCEFDVIYLIICVVNRKKIIVLLHRSLLSPKTFLPTGELLMNSKEWEYAF